MNAAPLLPALAALLLVACGGDTPPPPPAQTQTPEPRGAQPPTGPVDATYLCDGGNRVDLIDDRTRARLAMSDGRVVTLGAIGNSRPPTWSDVGLRFIVGDDYVELRQDSNGRTLHCTEQAAADDTDPERVDS